VLLLTMKKAMVFETTQGYPRRSLSTARITWSHEALRLFLILTQEQVNEGNLPNNRSPYVNRAMGNILPQTQAEFPELPGYTRKTLVNKFKLLSCE
ncbi:hypothetical protein COL922a_013804, partial [Colletotrichum nupharicola]